MVTDCAPWARPQENMTLGVLPEVLEEMTGKEKALIGLRPWYAYGRIGQAGHTAGWSRDNSREIEEWEKPGAVLERGDARANGGVGELLPRRK